MLELSDPHSWTAFTNWVLVAVSFIAAGYIGVRFLLEKRAQRLAKVRNF
jgi:hypothetical protein